MIWTPHATVATIVEKDERFLMVEELIAGQRVFNQPAGHVEANESIFDAAIRETLEETAWRVELSSFIGLYTYLAPSNQVMYYRMCFSAIPMEHTDRTLDKDIIDAHWLSRDELQNLPDSAFRSPLVLKCIEDYDLRPHLPLSVIYEHAKSDKP